MNFWVSVEKYRDLGGMNPNCAQAEIGRAALANQIFASHFQAESPEPVNVDAAAVNVITDLVVNQKRYPRDLFDTAQYQVNQWSILAFIICNK